MDGYCRWQSCSFDGSLEPVSDISEGAHVLVFNGAHGASRCRVRGRCYQKVRCHLLCLCRYISAVQACLVHRLQNMNSLRLLGCGMARQPIELDQQFVGVSQQFCSGHDRRLGPLHWAQPMPIIPCVRA